MPWILNLCPSGFLAGTGAPFTYTDCDWWGNAVADWELPAAAESEMETWTTNFYLGQDFHEMFQCFVDYIVIIFMFVIIGLM